MRKGKYYTVVTSSSQVTLATKVEEYMAKGYELVGGVQIIQGYVVDYAVRKPDFAQSLVKYEDDDESNTVCDWCGEDSGKIVATNPINKKKFCTDECVIAYKREGI